MAYDQYNGTAGIRKEVIDGQLKYILPKKFVFRQALNIDSTGGWKNTFFREDPTVLASTKTTAMTSDGFKNAARGADFEQASVAWEEVSTRILKFAAEDNLHWEDVLSDDIDVEGRTIIRIAEAIAKSEDSYIWNGLTTDTAIQTITIAQTKHWTGSSAAIIDNLMEAKENLKDYGYSTDNLICFISPRDERAIAKWITDKGAQFNSISNSTALNGEVPGIAGFRFVVSENVAASAALVVVPKRCATLKELESLKTETIDDPGKSRTIRAWEFVTLQVTEPLAIVKINNTQGDGTE